MSYSNSGYPGNQPNPDQWGGDPASQPSAGYPSSQPSAGYPGSQPSAGYADAQQSEYNPQQDYAQQMYADQQANYPGQPGTAPQQQQANYPRQPGMAPNQQWGPQAPRNDQDNVFKAVFDFGFTRYATPGVVKILYILGIVVGGIGWAVSGLFWIMIGGVLNPYSASGPTLIAVLSWLFGLIPLFFWIIGLRVSLEYALAIVRISQDSKAIREQQNA